MFLRINLRISGRAVKRVYEPWVLSQDPCRNDTRNAVGECGAGPADSTYLNDGEAELPANAL